MYLLNHFCVSFINFGFKWEATITSAAAQTLTTTARRQEVVDVRDILSKMRNCVKEYQNGELEMPNLAT